MSRQREKAQISVITSRGVKRGGCREWSGELNCWSDADANKWLKDTAAAHIVYWPSAEAWRWPEPGCPERTVLPGNNRSNRRFRRRQNPPDICWCSEDKTLERPSDGTTVRRIGVLQQEQRMFNQTYSLQCALNNCTITMFLTNELICLQL